MTMCPNTGKACECQPQDGVMCPHGPTPDWKPWEPEPDEQETPAGVTVAPAGYKLVPLEPTQDMLYAMAECDGFKRGDRDHPMLTRWEDYWRVAIAAAPDGVPVPDRETK